MSKLQNIYICISFSSNKVICTTSWYNTRWEQSRWFNIHINQIHIKEKVLGSKQSSLTPNQCGNYT